MLRQKALLYGIATFAAFYTAHLMIVPLFAGIVDKPGTSTSLYILHQVLGLATVIVSGYVAGAVAGARRFLHGFTVGAAGTLLSALAAYWVNWLSRNGASPIANLFLWLPVNGFLSGLGALFSQCRRGGTKGRKIIR